jgi:hypothetical protein
MNLFLLIQSALVALTGSAAARISSSKPLADRHAIAAFGLALALGWLLVAISSYSWVKTWRAHMMTLGLQLKDACYVDPSSVLFTRDKRSARYPNDPFSKLIESFSWYVRPTLVTSCLPVLFAVGWIYLGWFA